MQKGAFDDAARMYQELVRAVPGDAGLLMNLGMALAMGGHEQEAIGPLERAVKLKPALIPAQLFLGAACCRTRLSTLAVGGAILRNQPPTVPNPTYPGAEHASGETDRTTFGRASKQPGARQG